MGNSQVGENSQDFQVERGTLGKDLRGEASPANVRKSDVQHGREVMSQWENIY